MKAFSHHFGRPWTLVAVVAILLATHGLAFYFIQHSTISLTLASGLIVLIVVKHLGMFGSVCALLRKRSRKIGSSHFVSLDGPHDPK